MHNSSKGQTHHDEDTECQRAESRTEDGDTWADFIAAHRDYTEDHGHRKEDQSDECPTCQEAKGNADPASFDRRTL